MLERLLSFYDQLPTASRQPYGKFINVARFEGVDVAAEQVRAWMKRCEA